ncbi:MAG TPA: tRNA (5-methylaminomethyl-2-thiouridine)(34)-methyltransferase MnmD [Saprospiraceae bacterium]|nr:tRNA (5-methylaminomethyl-2-thiouridine)(34)-methyltransferase MnmD [Saprospiraceae bacterium]HMQ81836.1 tRNA (5-methylaminomethyl-2-thiouridine)(34)-methyltransferase MnmD [Saprospiraceae bacterium]
MSDLSLIETQDGSHSLLSQQLGVSYHSRYGAIQESRHVFIQAGLQYQMLKQKQGIRILEIGFGTGLNALLTLLEAEQYKYPIHYVGLEAYPIALHQVAQLNYPHQLAQEGLDLPALFRQLHESNWGEWHSISPFFHFRKELIHFEEADYTEAFDLIYFDAFAPGAQPELWEKPLMQSMYQALRPDGVLVTYCAKGMVKRTLREVGFRVIGLPGPPGKREMTRAEK